ncbi:DUF2975 domain-containing protein [Modestobacter sp. NPDC049651]|uniref:DUF2975 domain-containing protein n=1 Tax=unclassified Modestobacter TaxID=2643866 RepID=UPI0033D553EF
MSELRRVVVPLRVVLALVFAALVVVQTVALPVALRDIATESPELAHLRWPTLAFAVLELLCVQAVIACTWKLLTRVRDDLIFSEQSLGWVDAIVGAVVAAWLLLLSSLGYVTVNGDLPDLPAVLLVLWAVLLLVTGALGLLMVVLRALLRQATTLRTDMEAVI